MIDSPTYIGFIAMSIDGFISDEDGGVGWLDPFNKRLGDAGEDGGYADFIKTIDALMMGRTTYEQVMGWGWPYEKRPAYVLTGRSGYSGEHIETAGDIRTLGSAINAKEHRNVWIVGGGETQRTCLDAGLFDKLHLFVMPVLLGRGRACFSAGASKQMKLVASRRLPGGIIKLDYEIESTTT